jgi:hypothetical protein
MTWQIIVLLVMGVAAPDPPTFKVVAVGESHRKAEECRKMVVGPGVNQPDAFSGYRGFVGWESPARLRDGTMFVAFNAGYWHASFPTPLKVGPGTERKYLAAGMPPGVDAPRGGRAMIVQSTDGGVNWSKPRTLVDTPYDDRHPAITELSDGTLVCSLFTHPGFGESEEVDPSKGHRMGVVRSFDGGKTWEQEPHQMPPGYLKNATDGPPVELPDRSILLVGEGKEKSGQYSIGVFRSTNRGATWTRLANVAAQHRQYEPSLARLHSGELVMISRPEGAITWSRDEGRTWTEPVGFGVRMFAPTLLVMADGTLLCHYGSYNEGGLRAMFSTDGGHTWVVPGDKRGFLVDNTYGYSRSCLMPDGSAYLAYIGTKGYKTEEATHNMIWSIRLRVRPDHSGIELEPIK